MPCCHAAAAAEVTGAAAAAEDGLGAQANTATIGMPLGVVAVAGVDGAGVAAAEAGGAAAEVGGAAAPERRLKQPLSREWGGWRGPPRQPQSRHVLQVLLFWSRQPSCTTRHVTRATMLALFTQFELP